MPRKVISRPSICPLFQKGTPIHLSQKCLWREIISKRKQILWRDIALCEITTSVESTDSGDGVWLECGLSGRAGRCRSTRIPEQGDSATLEPAYLTRLKDTVTVKFLRLKGSGRRCPFLSEARKACSAPRPKDTRQNAITEGSHPRLQPCLSCCPGGF